jgi:hypothetical protein
MKIKEIITPINFQEAFEYVNQRFVYNDIHYPALRRLNSNESVIFALKHNLLHLLKNTEHLKFFQNSEEFFRIINEQEKSSFVKIWINLLSITNIFIADNIIISLKIFEQKNIRKFQSDASIHRETISFMKNLAIHLEEADHRGFINLNEGTIFENYIDLISLYYGISERFFKNIWEEIPNYMKSK